MDKSLIKIKNIFPELNGSWENIYIKDVKIFKSSEKAILVLTSTNGNLSDKEFDLLKDKFKNYLSALDLEIEFEPIEEEDIEEFIKNSLIRDLSIKEYNFLIKIEKREINISFFTKIDENKINKIKDYCSEKGYTLNYKTVYKELNVDNYIDKIENEEAILDKKFMSLNITENKKIIKVPSETNNLKYKKIPKYNAPEHRIIDLTSDIGPCTTEGVIFKVDFKEIMNGEKEIMTIYYSDNSESIYTKLFLKTEDAQGYKNSIKTGMGIKVIGEINYDNFVNSSYIKPAYFEAYNIEPRKDSSDEKRIELHLHTNMSAQDGITDIKSYIKRAKYWGHEAIAITDHSVVQAYPEGMHLAKDLDMKIIYGAEINLVDDEESIIKNSDYIKNKDSFVIFDVETTGFSSRNDKIIEIGAVKVKNCEIIDSYNILINPLVPLPDEIVNLTGINDSMLVNQPTIDKVLPDFYDFIKDSILVAHNANFDIAFLRNNFNLLGIEFNPPFIDTLELSRIKYPFVRSHKLSNVAKRLGVSLENAHRAVDDARATGEIFIKLLDEEIRDREFEDCVFEIEKLKNIREKHLGNSYHAVLLVKDYKGLKNLYEIISASHMDYFNYTPKVPKSVLNKHRDGLLVSSACQDGELYQGLINNLHEKKIKEICEYYDYFEIQPSKNNLNLIPSYFKTEKELESLNRKIIELGDEYNKLVVATGDVHYLDSDLRETRKILKQSIKMKSNEYDNDYSFLTTDEMLEEFSYLGPRAFEVVINNTKKIESLIEDISPIPSGTYPPKIEGSDTMLRNITIEKAHEIYGDVIPENILNRINVELDSIIKNGYSVLYIIAQKLVKKSNEDGYQVGSRGSVGSSIVATLCGITEVNPLAPHYSCPSCKYSEFINTQESQIFSGHDLPDKKCPVCDTDLNKFGDEIPFEVFLGFDGDKEPDIDLNFAGEYQSTSHKYTEELFGKGKVFRAGTIGTIAEKTAYGYVLKYIEETGINKSKAEIERLSQTLVGIKRSTGQHAGGIMIVPDYKDIHDFSPIQRPANDKFSEVTTTHYDYNAISGTILKLDILGHDVPSMIKMIEDLTGTDFMKAPLNDKKVLSLFSNADSLNLDKNIFNIDVGTLGVPEFGTNFVQKMLKATKPETFAELVQISGLSHGTNVWTGNAEELVNQGKASLKEVISTREDIMQDLINAGADKKFAFYTMEKVRKGKGLNEEEESIISQLDLPDWYIDSLNKISYMFPKAHAVAYVTMSVRLAYYKVYYPEAFYATYLSTKISNFDLETITKGPSAIKEKLSQLKASGFGLSNKEKLDIPIYEICLEMYARNCKLGKLGIYESQASKFTIIDNMIIPPFRTVPSLGENVANLLVSCRKDEEFLSIEDMIKKTKISKTSIDYLKNIGILDGLSESNQLSLF